MGDLIRDSFTRFHQSIAASYQDLNENRTRIEDRKDQMLRLLETGIQIPEPPSGAGEYQDLCRDMMHSAKVQLQSWQLFIRGQIERSEFVNRHEKSILALVFADVNAGKSSLGNFVGGWNFRDTAYADLYQPHDCEIEDFSTASKENRQIRTIDHFEENATEATSTIQHYTLQQGLTWVDTPGLHSLTKEHGDLAKEYIQFADLVIYLTPSSSPFKTDEREMLEELFRMGKPVILAITKSDMTIQDEVDDRIVTTLVPKSDADRKAQEGYVAEELRKIPGSGNLENSHMLSLSVRLARDAVRTQDSELYGTSNLDKFLSQMSEILSSKAIELKMRRPKTEVNAFIDRLIGKSGKPEENFLTIAQLRTELSQKSQNLQNVLTKCRKSEAEICARVEQQFPISLSLLFRSLRDRKLIQDETTVRQEASKNISELVAEVCRKSLSELLGKMSISVDLPRIQLNSGSTVPYEVQTAEKIVLRSIKREPKGILEHVQRFLNKDSEFWEIVNDTESIAIGDNLKSFLDAQVESLRPEVKTYISATIERMASACVDPMLERYQQLDKQLEQLTGTLESLRFAE